MEPAWTDELFVAVLQQLHDPVAVVTRDGDLLCANNAFADLVDLDRLLVAQLVAPGRDRRFLPLRDGSSAEFVLHVVPAPDRVPHCYVVELTPSVGERDPLTGLASRAVLLRRLVTALRTQPEVELLVLDLDGFKEINDRHGHLVGDEVLVAVARRLAALSRPGDTLCRWGGDEFVVLLSGSAAKSAHLLCQRIESALEEPVRLADGQSLSVAVSCGWACGANGDDPASLLHAADMDMYESKRRRRRNWAPGSRELLSARLEQAQARADELRRMTARVREQALATWRAVGPPGRGSPQG